MTTTTWQQKIAQSKPDVHVHLLGIGGAGLSAIAQVLLEMGVRVSGSDRQISPRTARLMDAGATVYPQQAAANLSDLPPHARPDVVLISSAVPPENPERQAAEQLNIPVVKRNDFLSVLLSGRRVIGIAGTHGKSTTTAMTVKVLSEGGLDVGYIIGTDLPGFGNAHAGTHEIFVIEADEYDRMFLGLQPQVAVITNVEWDHPDCYPTPQSFTQAFVEFVERVQPDGCVISCTDDAGAEALRLKKQGAQKNRPTWIRYGTDATAHMRGLNPQPVPESGLRTPVQWNGTPAGEMALQVLGMHNLRNALAAASVGQWCGVPFAKIWESLHTFAGTARRLEQKGIANEVLVFDDYAHHPTEVRATLAALRQRFPQRRVWAVFQPHTFSRTHELLTEMSNSFEDADCVLVTDIYAAREQDTGRVHARDIVTGSNHASIQHTPTLADATAHLVQHVAPGDVVVTLGAGDGYQIGEALLAQLDSTESPAPVSA